MEKERDDSLEELLKFVVEDTRDYLDPDLLKEEKEQRKLHLRKANSQRLPKDHAAKGKSWSWNRIRSRPNTKHGYH